MSELRRVMDLSARALRFLMLSADAFKRGYHEIAIEYATIAKRLSADARPLIEPPKGSP